MLVSEPGPADYARGAAAGLIAGVVASFATDRFQAALGSLASSDSKSEPATDTTANAIAKTLTGEALNKPDKQRGGQAVHYALGGTLGLVYGIAAEYRPEVTAGYGTGFGAGVAVVLDEAAVPALKLAPSPTKTSPDLHLYSLASHLVFGLVTEFTRRQLRKV